MTMIGTHLAPALRSNGRREMLRPMTAPRSNPSFLAKLEGLDCFVGKGLLAIRCATAAFHGIVETIEQLQGIRMLKLYSAVLFGAVPSRTPSYAARCGGDFQTFVAARSAEAAGGRGCRRR